MTTARKTIQPAPSSRAALGRIIASSAPLARKGRFRDVPEPSCCRRHLCRRANPRCPRRTITHAISVTPLRLSREVGPRAPTSGPAYTSVTIHQFWGWAQGNGKKRKPDDIPRKLLPPGKHPAPRRMASWPMTSPTNPRRPRRADSARTKRRRPRSHRARVGRLQLWQHVQRDRRF